MALQITTTWLTPRWDRPLLVVGPSLGTSGAQLWRECVEAMGDEVAVVSWDLPGHAGAPVGQGFHVADLADAVLRVAEDAARVLAESHGRAPADRFAYAGDSLGGAVGLQLLTQAPDAVCSAVLVSTGALIGDPAAWHERAATVRAHGTRAVAEGSVERWFSARTRAERPEVVDALVATLLEVDREGYAQCCEALARFDLTSLLPSIDTPVLAVAGQEDVPTPVSCLAAIADGVIDGRLVVLTDVAHLPPAEQPDVVARLVAGHLRQSEVAR